ncbi:MAG: hypothetical protein RDV41_00375 [Planctomycetota bacterium]|nr:hypothetical protein [Planctomycetota bacterium]
MHTQYKKLRIAGVRWTVRPGYEPLVQSVPTEESSHADPWRLVKEYPIKKVLQLPSERARELLGDRVGSDEDSAGFILKIYRPASNWSRLLSLLRVSKAEREFDTALEIHRRGIATVLPTAVGIRRRHGLVLESYVIFPRLAGVVGLDEFLRATFTEFPGRREGTRAKEALSSLLPGAHSPREFRVAVIQAYGRFARSVHDAGINQDDFDPNNILLSFDAADFRLGADHADDRVRRAAAGGTQEGSASDRQASYTTQLRIVDFERARVGLPLPLSRRTWLLAKLNRFRAASVSDRVRFLIEYCREPAPGPAACGSSITPARDRRGPAGGERHAVPTKLQCAVPGHKELAVRIVAEEDRVQGRDLRRAAENCCEENRNTGFFSHQGMRGHYRKKYPWDEGITSAEADLLAEKVIGPAPVLTLPPGYEVLTFEGPASADRALALWKVTNALLRVGIPVQPPILVAATTDRGRSSKACVICYSHPSQLQSVLELKENDKAAALDRSRRLAKRVERAFRVWRHGRPARWELPDRLNLHGEAILRCGEIVID